LIQAAGTTAGTSTASPFHSLSIASCRRRPDGAGVIGVGAIAAAIAAARAPAPASSRRSYSFTMPSPTSLDAVMRTEHLADRTADEIEEIWMAFHGEGGQQQQHEQGDDGGAASSSTPSTSSPPPAGEHCVGTVLSAEEYKVLSARAKASPMFVLPLRKTVVRRGGGGGSGGGSSGADAADDHPTSSQPPTPPTTAYLTLLLQWQLPLLLVTTVDEYRRLGPSAPPHLVATFYPQLADSKGVVLARADLTGGGGVGGVSGKVRGGAVASRAEARTVLELARAFYTDGEMHRLAYRFNHDQKGFDFAELLRALGFPEGAAPVAE
jgi:hypothetical protein